MKKPKKEIFDEFGAYVAYFVNRLVLENPENLDYAKELAEMTKIPVYDGEKTKEIRLVDYMRMKSREIGRRAGEKIRKELSKNLGL
jgi:hypothetical protein